MSSCDMHHWGGRSFDPLGEIIFVTIWPVPQDLVYLCLPVWCNGRSWWHCLQMSSTAWHRMQKNKQRMSTTSPELPSTSAPSTPPTAGSNLSVWLSQRRSNNIYFHPTFPPRVSFLDEVLEQTGLPRGVPYIYNGCIRSSVIHRPGPNCLGLQNTAANHCRVLSCLWGYL